MALSWVSFRDDCREVSIGSRLVAHVIAVVLIICALRFEGTLLITLILLGVIMVAYINFVNFMDGINGLVVGLMVLIPVGVLCVAPRLATTRKIYGMCIGRGCGRISSLLIFQKQKCFSEMWGVLAWDLILLFIYYGL